MVHLGLRMMLQDFVTTQPDEQEHEDNVGEQPDPSDMLEVRCATDFLMSELAEVSEEDVQNCLKEFNLNDYPLSDNPSPSFTPSPPNDTNFDQFANISKNLDSNESCYTAPERFADIVQQALYDPSVFGHDAFDFSF